MSDTFKPPKNCRDYSRCVITETCVHGLSECVSHIAATSCCDAAELGASHTDGRPRCAEQVLDELKGEVEEALEHARMDRRREYGKPVEKAYLNGWVRCYENMLCRIELHAKKHAVADEVGGRRNDQDK